MLYDQEKQSIPLTNAQKGILLYRCLPVVFSLVIVALLLTTQSNNDTSLLSIKWLILALLLIASVYQVLKYLRDLFSGIAVVSQDTLETAYRPYGPVILISGRFTNLGRVKLTQNAYRESQPGQTYWVYYSPVSRTVWKLEPTD